MFDALVIRTKLTPPRQQRHTLRRPRLTRRLTAALAYRLTLVNAGTGYGKSTALAALAGEDVPVAWYSIAEEDSDPFVFVLHLIYACRRGLPDLPDAPLTALERQRDRGSPAAWPTVVDMLVNALAETVRAPTLLVLDDYHLVKDVPAIATMVDRLIGYAPADLHVILSGRQPPDLPGLVVWRTRGELLEIGREDLAFTPHEIASLFRQQYDRQLSPDELAALASETEGWAIALQLIGQSLRSGAAPDLATGLAGHSLDTLFTYLAQEVLNRQPQDVQAFLTRSSVLRQLDAAACDAVRDADDSVAFLKHLRDQNLFLIELGDGQSRYHHLFHDFLRQQLPPAARLALHERAAAYYQDRGDEEAAVYHLLAVGAQEQTASLLGEMGEKLVRQGRLDTLAGWVGQLPPAVLEEHPVLLTYLGDIARLRSRFDAALGWYSQAEARWRARDDRLGASQALQRQALVYLDTVRPARATKLLEEAVRLTDGYHDRHNRVQLLELMAENQLNLGHPEEAERLRAEARQWRDEGPSESQLAVRVLLRTGRLDEARALLEAQAAAETEGEQHPEPSRAHQSHRETQLLLSLTCAFQGEVEAARRAAERGIAIGQQLGSPFVTAVGYMRLGHTWLIRSAPNAHLHAIDCFKQAIALGNVVAVRRTRVEAQWGLCRTYGFHGDPTTAEEAAALGVKIGRRASDPWVVALIQLNLGATYVLAGRHSEAVELLAQVATAFRDCSDNHGRAAARLWQALAYQRLGQTEPLLESVDELLELTQVHGYDHLFVKPALLGPPDQQVLVPLLLEARRQGRRAATADRLLQEMGLSRVEFHPGYRLRVQTLGPFRVWRGETEVDAREWRRSKARQLFQLLLTHRGHLLQREEIVDILWPELDPDAAQRDFKVALNAVNRALEPDRTPGAEPAYVRRHDTTYGLRPHADLWLDADAFQEQVATGDASKEDEARATAYQNALDLYQGEYLQETLYEDWFSEERERLLTLYLRTAEKLAGVRLGQGRYDEVIGLCRRILARDDCWERAYRLMMVAYARQGNRARALRAYQSLVETLQRELAARPGAATQQIYECIVEGQTVDEGLI